jgi:hypothetical protein
MVPSKNIHSYTRLPTLSKRTDLLRLHKKITKSGPNPWRKLPKRNSNTNLVYRKLKLLYHYETSDTVSAESMALFSSQAVPHFSGLFSFLCLSVSGYLSSHSLALFFCHERLPRARDLKTQWSPLFATHEKTLYKPLSTYGNIQSSNFAIQPLTPLDEDESTMLVRNLAMELMQYLQWRQQRGGTHGR